MVLPAATVTPKPAGLDFTSAAAIPLAGAAAVQSIVAIDPQPRQTVLVHGASGGGGSFAVQLLAARGVTVVATGSAADTDRLTELGAARVIDRASGSVAEQVRTAYPDGVDALLSLAGYSPDDVPVAAVRKGGKVAGVAAVPDEATLAAAGLTGTSVMAAATKDVVAPLAEQAAAGTLKVGVSSVVPLDQAAEGLGRLAAGGVGGKIVVTLDD